MSAIGFSPSTSQKVADMEQAYLAACAAPLDGMWQSFADMAEIYEIVTDQNTIGYAAINGDDELLRFHVSHGINPAPVLSRLIQETGLSGAVISTAEPCALAALMDVQQSVSVHAIMYQMPNTRPLSVPRFPGGTVLKQVAPDELESVADFAQRTLGASLDWLLSYFDGLIRQGELYALWQNNEVLATGECRRNTRQPDVADVGMIVGKPHRRKGIATEMLKALAQKAMEQNLSPICSTETGNIGAQKAITAAGFVSCHRILKIRF